MNVLLFGAGSKWGAHFTRYLADHDCKIDLVTSSNFQYNNVSTYHINWHTVNLNDLKNLLSSLPEKKYDLIFFNQNGGGGPNDKFYSKEFTIDQDRWNKSYWVDVQLPYYVIKNLTNSISEKTKIGWMLTGLINGIESKHWKYAGYAGAKTTNLHIMRGFSQFHPGIFFCLNPIWFPPDTIDADCLSIYSVINSLVPGDTGKVFTKDGIEWKYFKKIY